MSDYVSDADSIAEMDVLAAGMDAIQVNHGDDSFGTASPVNSTMSNGSGDTENIALAGPPQLDPTIPIGNIGNNFQMFSVFGQNPTLSIIPNNHDFKGLVTQHQMLRVYNIKTGFNNKMFNISVASIAYVNFINSLYTQYQMTAIAWINRPDDEWLAPEEKMHVRQVRAETFNDLLFERGIPTIQDGAPDYQCLAKRFRDFIVIPVLQDKYMYNNVFPAAFGGNAAEIAGYFNDISTELNPFDY